LLPPVHVSATPESVGWPRSSPAYAVRISLLALVAAAALGFTCLPFRTTPDSKGPVQPNLACRAPIFIGWTGGKPSASTSDAGAVFDTRLQCGGAARFRLAAVAVVLVILAGGVWLTDRQERHAGRDRSAGRN